MSITLGTMLLVMCDWSSHVVIVIEMVIYPWLLFSFFGGILMGGNHSDECQAKKNTM